jgi:hypothetical protein
VRGGCGHGCCQASAGMCMYRYDINRAVPSCSRRGPVACCVAVWRRSPEVMTAGAGAERSLRALWTAPGGGLGGPGIGGRARGAVGRSACARPGVSRAVLDSLYRHFEPARDLGQRRAGSADRSAECWGQPRRCGASPVGRGAWAAIWSMRSRCSWAWVVRSRWAAFLSLPVAVSYRSRMRCCPAR